MRVIWFGCYFLLIGGKLMADSVYSTWYILCILRKYIALVIFSLLFVVSGGFGDDMPMKLMSEMLSSEIKTSIFHVTQWKMKIFMKIETTGFSTKIWPDIKNVQTAVQMQMSFIISGWYVISAVYSHALLKSNANMRCLSNELVVSVIVHRSTLLFSMVHRISVSQ